MYLPLIAISCDLSTRDTLGQGVLTDDQVLFLLYLIIWCLATVLILNGWEAE